MVRTLPMTMFSSISTPIFSKLATSRLTMALGRRNSGRAEEVHHAKEEGIVFDLLTNPVSIEGDETGHVQSITCVKMELGEPDASGRRRPVVIEGSEFNDSIPISGPILPAGGGPALRPVG